MPELGGIFRGLGAGMKAYGDVGLKREALDRKARAERLEEVARQKLEEYRWRRRSALAEQKAAESAALQEGRITAQNEQLDRKLTAREDRAVLAEEGRWGRFAAGQKAQKEQLDKRLTAQEGLLDKRLTAAEEARRERESRRAEERRKEREEEAKTKGWQPYYGHIQPDPGGFGDPIKTQIGWQHPSEGIRYSPGYNQQNDPNLRGATPQGNGGGTTHAGFPPGDPRNVQPNTGQPPSGFMIEGQMVPTEALEGDSFPVQKRPGDRGFARENPPVPISIQAPTPPPPQMPVPTQAEIRFMRQRIMENHPRVAFYMSEWQKKFGQPFPR